MRTSNITLLKKIAHGLRNTKAKFSTADMLANEIGIMPEKIQEACAEYNPLVKIDFGFDLKGMLPLIDARLSELAAQAKPARKLITKKKIAPYNSVVEFIYDRMTFGGIVDKTLTLKDDELRMIRRLAGDELKSRRAQTKNK